MKTFDKVATRHYVRSSQIFHSNPIKAPAQLFLSKIDPVGAVSSNQRLRESWESAGLKVRFAFKIFESILLFVFEYKLFLTACCICVISSISLQFPYSFTDLELAITSIAFVLLLNQFFLGCFESYHICLCKNRRLSFICVGWCCTGVKTLYFTNFTVY